MFIKLNSIGNEKISINPEHIVAVIGETCSSIIITIVEKYYVVETQEEIDNLIDPNSKKSNYANWKPLIGDYYRYFDLTSGELLSGVCLDNNFHNFNIKHGNFFKNELAAFSVNSNIKSAFLKHLIEVRENEKSN